MKYLILILLISCSTVKPSYYQITQIRLAPNGSFIVWFGGSKYYRFYKELPDSFQVGRVVKLGK